VCPLSEAAIAKEPPLGGKCEHKGHWSARCFRCIKRDMGRKQQHGGFTLIEMAIVISICSLLLAGFLRFSTVQMEKHRLETTKNRLENLRLALTLYSATHERLPCPASPPGAKAPAQGRDGKDADACAPDAQKPPGVVVYSSDPHSEDQSLQVWIGVVPIQELRLGGDQGTDGWGNAFTYAVSRRLTFPQGMRGNPLPDGIISVVDENGKNVLDKPDTGRYVIVSHGSSGAGSWTVQGIRRPCLPDTADSRNCNGGSVFVIAPLSLKPGPTFYDDIVIHDDANAGGSLLDRIAACSLQRAFYIPAAPDADQDGCSRQQNLLQGACQLQIVRDDDGASLPSVPNAVLPPALVNGAECGCAPGYTIVKVGTWYDTSPLLPSAHVIAPPANGMQHIQTALFSCTQ
jgi:prepilin-type N-terminal cleavage/methylation domain-containing protein